MVEALGSCVPDLTGVHGIESDCRQQPAGVIAQADADLHEDVIACQTSKRKEQEVDRHGNE
jgi:hypothetical protein